jgi:hypothetical protein
VEYEPHGCFAIRYSLLNHWLVARVHPLREELPAIPHERLVVWLTLLSGRISPSSNDWPWP